MYQQSQIIHVFFVSIVSARRFKILKNHLLEFSLILPKKKSSSSNSPSQGYSSSI